MLQGRRAGGSANRELVAWYIENDEPEPFKTVKLNDETLELTFRPKEYSDVMLFVALPPVLLCSCCLFVVVFMVLFAADL